MKAGAIRHSTLSDLTIADPHAERFVAVIASPYRLSGRGMNKPRTKNPMATRRPSNCFSRHGSTVLSRTWLREGLDDRTIEGQPVRVWCCGCLVPKG